MPRRVSLYSHPQWVQIPCRPMVVPGLGGRPAPVHVERSNCGEVIEIVEDSADGLVGEDRLTAVHLAHVAVGASGGVELVNQPQLAVD